MKKHRLVLHTQHVPKLSGDERSFWEKLSLVKFPFSFSGCVDGKEVGNGKGY